MIRKYYNIEGLQEGGYPGEEEIWKDVFGYENYYQISTKGNIKSKDRVISRSGKTFIKRSKNLKKYITTNGYEAAGLTGSVGKSRVNKIHRLLAQAFIPNPNNLPHINHKDGNKLNNNLDNLEWCTHQYNVKHAYDMGLNKGYKILTKEQVEEIRNKYKPYSYSNYRLAKEYGVGVGCISQVVRNLNWKKDLFTEEDMVTHLSNLIEGYDFSDCKSWSALRTKVREYLQPIRDNKQANK